MRPGGRADHPIELLSASIDRELRPAETAALEAHLEACAECRGLLHDFRKLDEAMVSEPPPAVPAGLEQRILAALPVRGPLPSARPFWRQAMPLATAACFVVAVIAWFARPDRLPPLSGTAPAATAKPKPNPAEPPAPRSDARAALEKSADPVPAPAPVPTRPRSRASAAQAPEKKSVEPPAGNWKVGSVPPQEQMAARQAAEEGRLLREADELQHEPRIGANAAPMATAAAVQIPPPVGLFASPYVVTLETDGRMLVHRGKYNCTVPIEDDDRKVVTSALEEIVGASEPAPRAMGREAGPRIVTATPQGREAVLRLVKERYRRMLETRCGPLPG